MSRECFLSESLPKIIAATARRELAEIYVYLYTRIGSGWQGFHQSFLKTLNYHFLENLNQHLKHKVPDNYIVNQNFIFSVAKSLYDGMAKKMNLDEMDELVSEYNLLKNSDELPKSLQKLIQLMSRTFYELILKAHDQPGIESRFGNLFLSISMARTPCVPKIEIAARADGRDIVKSPFSSRTVSITGYDGQADDGESADQIYRTTIFMQQGGPGSSHAFNPTNDQATQAVGYWQEGGEGHFVSGTQSFKGKHAEWQVMELFKGEMDKHPQLVQAKKESKTITLHLFISKSPCVERCIPMLKKFLLENPQVNVEFYFQQWYESNNPRNAFNNAREFLRQINSLVGRVNYHYLPLATSARLLYEQRRTMHNPFKSMPEAMIDGIYAAYADADRMDKIKDDPRLAKKREKVWLRVQAEAEKTLRDFSVTDAGGAAAAAPAATPASAAAAVPHAEDFLTLDNFQAVAHQALDTGMTVDQGAASSPIARDDFQSSQWGALSREGFFGSSSAQSAALSPAAPDDFQSLPPGDFSTAAGDDLTDATIDFDNIDDSVLNIKK